MEYGNELSVILRKYRAHYITKGNMETTANQIVEKLGRILLQLQTSYDVRYTRDKIEGLTNRVLLEWYASMGEKGRKISTINNYIVILNPFLAWAVDMEYLDNQDGKRPIQEILKTARLPDEDKIPEEERKQKMFTHEEVERLVSGMTGRNVIRDRAIAAVILGSAIRASELCGLTVGSVYGRKRGMIYLRRKGGAWKETPLAEFAYPFLDAYMKTKPEELRDFSAPLFMSQKGKPLDRVALWKSFARKEKQLSLQTGIHILRHTVVTEAERVGGAATARDIANHKSIRMTNKYDHSTEADRREAVGKFRWNNLTPPTDTE